MLNIFRANRDDIASHGIWNKDNMSGCYVTNVSFRVSVFIKNVLLFNLILTIFNLDSADYGRIYPRGTILYCKI